MAKTNEKRINVDSSSIFKLKAAPCLANEDCMQPSFFVTRLFVLSSPSISPLELELVASRLARGCRVLASLSVVCFVRDAPRPVFSARWPVALTASFLVGRCVSGLIMFE